MSERSIAVVEGVRRKWEAGTLTEAEWADAREKLLELAELPEGYVLESIILFAGPGWLERADPKAGGASEQLVAFEW